MPNALIIKGLKQTKKMIATIAATHDKHDLSNRKLPLTEWIYAAAIEKRVEATVIRGELELKLNVTTARRSQMENLRKSDKATFRRKHINTINAYFSATFRKPCCIEAEFKGNLSGLFSPHNKIF